jgi:hypothetical protein
MGTNRSFHAKKYNFCFSKWAIWLLENTYFDIVMKPVVTRSKPNFMKFHETQVGEIS